MRVTQRERLMLKPPMRSIALGGLLADFGVSWECDKTKLFAEALDGLACIIEHGERGLDLYSIVFPPLP